MNSKGTLPSANEGATDRGGNNLLGANAERKEFVLNMMVSKFIQY